MIDTLFQGGALPVLERVLDFSSQRQRVLSDNIANLSTPYFKPRDLSVKGFQSALRRAVNERRERGAAAGGPLVTRDSLDFRFHGNSLDARARASNEGILFHDQNNRDLERQMQHLAENTLTFNMTVDLIRSEIALLRTAIRERL